MLHRQVRVGLQLSYWIVILISTVKWNSFYILTFHFDVKTENWIQCSLGSSFKIVRSCILWLRTSFQGFIKKITVIHCYENFWFRIWMLDFCLLNWLCHWAAGQSADYTSTQFICFDFFSVLQKREISNVTIKVSNWLCPKFVSKIHTYHVNVGSLFFLKKVAKSVITTYLCK